MELEEQFLYIRDKLKEPKIAIKKRIELREKIKILEIFPRAHKLISKSKKFEYRKLIIKKNIIIYRINLKESKVEILHIYNSKQFVKEKTINNKSIRTKLFVLF